MVKEYRKKGTIFAAKFDGTVKSFSKLAPWDCKKPPELLEDKSLAIVNKDTEFIAHPGDYILKGVRGALYPINAELFEKQYEEVVK